MNSTSYIMLYKFHCLFFLSLIQTFVLINQYLSICCFFSLSWYSKYSQKPHLHFLQILQHFILIVPRRADPKHNTIFQFKHFCLGKCNWAWGGGGGLERQNLRTAEYWPPISNTWKNRCPHNLTKTGTWNGGGETHAI